MPCNPALPRRRLLGALGLLCAARPLLAAGPDELVVLTGHAEPALSAFAAAFRETHPEYRLNLIRRQPHEALALLSRPDQGGVDVYWSSSPRTFEALRQSGAWRPLHLDRGELPECVGGLELVGPQGHYLATEMVGHGFAIDPPTLAALGVPRPRDWTDLVDPRLAGRIALPVPSQFGFAAAMVDIVLQAHGWERGWALWSEIAGLSCLVRHGSGTVRDEVGDRRAAVGLSADAPVADDAPLEFVYPASGGLAPGHVAITAASAHPLAAEAFVAFLLSERGQRLLSAPGIRKLPVRPSVYRQLPAGYHDPFRAAATGAYPYRGDSADGRLGLIATLFEQMLVHRHEELCRLWARVHELERQLGVRLDEIRRQLCKPPLDERQARDPQLLAIFRHSLEGSPQPAGQTGWPQLAEQQRRQAAKRLTELEPA